MTRWIATLAVLVACSSDEGEENTGPPPEPVTVVKVATAGSGSVADLLVTSATIESEASADLVPEATGTVLSVHKDEGDAVKAGDLLAVLDSVSLGSGAAKARAEVARLQDQVNQSRSLRSQGAISERELNDLEYQLQTAKMSSREASRSYGQTRLTAPFDGVIAMRDVRVGELATSARTAFQVVDLTTLRAVTRVPERELSRVRSGQPARLISAYDSEVWASGDVARVAPVVDPDSGTFRVTVGVDPEQQRLRPGQFVSVELEVDRHNDVLVVPKKAVVYEDGMPVVYRIVPEEPPEEGEDAGEEGGSEEETAWWWPFPAGEAAAAEEGDEDTEELGLVAERVVVELGLTDAEFAEITDGLEDGDQVVEVGQNHLREGAKVRAAPDPDAEEDDPEEPETP